MNKVLIVDDEILTIEYLKSLSPWKKYGCTRVDSALISSKALECFQREHYPVVFVDVRMPGMDGLTLSREFLKICPDTTIVIMTAWQEFEYVKEAMQIGVKHFLVKHEITEETLDEVLAKIFAELDRQKNYQKALWNDWLRGLWEDGSHAEIPGKRDHPYFLVMFMLRGVSIFFDDTKESYLSEKEIRKLETGGITVRAFSRLESFTYGMFCEYAAPASELERQGELYRFLGALEKICREESGLKPVFFLSELKKEGESFEVFCASFKKFAHSIFWNRRGIVREKDFDRYERLEKSFFPDQAPETWGEQELKGLLERGKQGNFYLRLTDCVCVKTFLLRRVDWDYLRGKDDQVRMISMEQLIQMSLRFLEGEGIQKGRIVKLALDYIRSHYAEDITSSRIAEELGVSDGYLRAMFKRELSVTVKDYILQYRIERAKELLLKDGKKVYEIAEKCGFASSQHFSRVFHQVTGMTPGEYKQR